MVRETRAAANAAAASIPAAASIATPTPPEKRDGSAGSGGKRGAAHSEHESPVRKRRRGGEAVNGAPQDEVVGSSSGVVNGASPNAASEPQPRRLKVILKTGKIAAAAPPAAAPPAAAPPAIRVSAPETSKDQPVSQEPAVDGDKGQLGEDVTMEAAAAVPDVAAQAQSSEQSQQDIHDGPVDMADAGQEIVQHSESQPSAHDQVDDESGNGLSRKMKDGLLAIMIAMENTFAQTTDAAVSILDAPLVSSRPSRLPTAAQPVSKPDSGKKGVRTKPKKGKAKEKEKADVQQGQSIEGDWTVRRALLTNMELTLHDLESYFEELADRLTANTTNPFAKGPSKTAGPSSRSRSHSKATPQDAYVLALHSVVQSLKASIRSDAGVTPKPTIRWALHQSLPTPLFGAVEQNGVNQTVQDWFSSLIVSVEPVPEVEHKVESVTSSAAVGSHEGAAGVVSAPKKNPASTGKAVEIPSTYQAESTAEAGPSAVKREPSPEDSQVIADMLRANALGFASPIMVAPSDNLVTTLADKSSRLHVDLQAYEAMYGPPTRRGAAGPPVTLGQSIMIHASKKAGLWRKRKERGRPVGWVGKAVKFPAYEHTFMPSFAPTMDSSEATGGWGYDSTIDALRAKSSNRAWLASAWGRHVGRDWPKLLEQQEVEEQEEKQAVIEEERTEKEASARKVLSESLGIKNELAIDPSLVHAVVEARDPERELQERLEQNNRWMAELMAWQDIRVRRGQVDVVDPRENEIASRLAMSLKELAASTTPKQLIAIDKSKPLAVMLAEKIIPTSGPIVRGTLDPKRPRALIDNATAHLKPNALMLARPPPPPPAMLPVTQSSMRPHIPPMASSWPQRPPMLGNYPGPHGAPLHAPFRNQYAPPMPAGYSSPGYGQKLPPGPPAAGVYAPSSNGISYAPSPYGSPMARPPLANSTPIRGIGASMGLNLQSMSNPMFAPPGQRPSGLRGELR